MGAAKHRRKIEGRAAENQKTNPASHPQEKFSEKKGLY